MSGGRQIPICQLSYEDKSIGFYHTLLGGSASGALLEEVVAKGAKKYYSSVHAVLLTNQLLAESS